MTLRPTQLPKLRDQTRTFLQDPESAIRSATNSDLHVGLDNLVACLNAADLYWATPDMTALAMSSGAQLAAARWATADRPSPCGLMLFDGGLGTIDSHGVAIPVEAIVWGPARGKCMLWLLVSRRRMVQEVEQLKQPFTLVEEKIPPLMPVYGFALPVTVEPVPLIDKDLPQPIVAALAASWLLMQQRLLVERARHRPDKTTARSYARAGRPVPEVTSVGLRRQYVLSGQEDEGTDIAGRRYLHRWVVSGHWRDQPHGPDRALRRKTWIPSYVKGPEGAPLLSTEKVNVWRR
ncbi:hypothetical protein [Streptomyces purpureus]|uniref:Uncharacterized protein n=1 Tax=Streptomyces purpureus TaxID=1951 RepID=A0A918LXN2_9ACTN|nr:hypothetical protein [Streptomyces purpureus]GGT65359.1 hypothetical protein GCM10014713_67870 [Streptomyces purpureus]